MAFLVAAGVHYAVKGVQSGIQAHKDSKFDQPIEPPTDRYGNPKERHPVYGLVMKAKGKDKGKDHATSEVATQAGPSTGPELGTHNDRPLKEEYESENYGKQTYTSQSEVEPSPPTYEAAIGTPMTSHFGSPQHTTITSRGTAESEHSAHVSQAGMPMTVTPTSKAKTKPARRDSASSLSSDTSDSGSDIEEGATGPATISGQGVQPGRRAQKLQRKVHRAEKRLARASAKAERNVERRGERDADVRKVRKAEWKLEMAQRKLDRAS